MSRLEAEPIGTRRLILLPLRPEHSEEMAGVLADPALHAFIGGAPLSPPELRVRYERLAAGSPDPAVSWCNWVIQVRDPGRLAGTVQATIAGASELTAEVAWVVGTPGRAVASPPRQPRRSSPGWGGARSGPS